MCAFDHLQDQIQEKESWQSTPQAGEHSAGIHPAVCRGSDDRAVRVPRSGVGAEEVSIIFKVQEDQGSAVLFLKKGRLWRGNQYALTQSVEGR